MYGHNKNHHKTINNTECKHCPKCGLWVSIHLFYRDENRWDRLANCCKQCVSKYSITHPNLSNKKITCKYCGNKFQRPKRTLKYAKKHNKRYPKFCSHQCYRSSQRKYIYCLGCNDKILVPKHSKNKYCSFKCYDLHRPYMRISRLERFIQEQLLKTYHNLKFHFNRKDTIGSELDIYIPSLSLAFELNGPLHYEPIFGKDSFSRTQKGDKKKFHTCTAMNIDLCIINTSQQKTVNAKTSQKYLDMIIKIINNRF